MHFVRVSAGWIRRPRSGRRGPQSTRERSIVGTNIVKWNGSEKSYTAEAGKRCAKRAQHNAEKKMSLLLRLLKQDDGSGFQISL